MKTLLACVVLSAVAFTAKADAPIRAGDTFELRIGGVPIDDASSITSTYTVDGGGGLNLPYIGKLTIAGMTSSEVQSTVERTYVERGIFTHPSITLVIQPMIRFVNVAGHVKAPQRVSYTPDMTLLSAINAAGDFDEFAARKSVKIIRAGGAKIIDCRKPSNDIPVLPGDQIMVPEGFW